MPFTTLRELYTSKSASEVTSETYWVGDAFALSMQFVGAGSNTSIQGSNADGRDAAIAEASWSHITVVGPGIYDVEPGFRWMRCLRSLTTAANMAIQQPWTR